MSIINNKKDLEIIKQGGHLLREIKQRLLNEIKIGAIPLEVDNLAKKLIKEVGGYPSFMTVGDYKWATCISVNDEVVHGVPDKEPFCKGDVVGLDVGLLYKSWHTDTSATKFLKYQISNIKYQKETERFLETGKLALKKAIQQAKSGNRIGHISKTIQDTVEGAGYSVVRTLVGHGVGKKLHEVPQIPGRQVKPIVYTPEIKIGMVLAIEVIYNMGGHKIVYKNEDGWTLATVDKSLSGLFEETVLVTEKGPIVLT